MASDDLDAYLEHARVAPPTSFVPEGFTDSVMTAVRYPREVPPRFDFVTTAAPSGALVGTGAVLWLSGGDVVLSIAAVILMLSGFLWMWLDDPFGASMTIRLTPW
jgi:hypothetical protein